MIVALSDVVVQVVMSVKVFPPVTVIVPMSVSDVPKRYELTIPVVYSTPPFAAS